jgi:hypothetical protein
MTKEMLAAIDELADTIGTSRASTMRYLLGGGIKANQYKKEREEAMP